MQNSPPTQELTTVWEECRVLEKKSTIKNLRTEVKGTESNYIDIHFQLQEQVQVQPISVEVQAQQLASVNEQNDRNALSKGTHHCISV